MALRRWLPYLLLPLTIGLSAFLLLPHWHNTNVLKPLDYLQYWSAGRALVSGDNPYDGETLQALQTQVGTAWSEPIMMWNPPWALPWAIALGAIDWRLGQLIWLALNLMAVLVSAALLARLFQPPRHLRLLPMALALTFAPTFFLLFIGQISGLVLLGAVGSVVALHARRYGLAGLCLPLMALKPHLLLPLATLLFLQSFQDRRILRSIGLGILILTTASLIPLMVRPSIWNDYFSATLATSSSANTTIGEWIHPTLGYLIRQALPGAPLGGMFLPWLIVLPSLAIYWQQRRTTWHWPVEFPRVILASVLAAPYGAWAFDLVLLLVPLTAGGLRLVKTIPTEQRFRLALTYALFNIIALFTLLLPMSMTNFWLAPLVLLAYLAVEQAGKQPQITPIPIPLT